MTHNEKGISLIQLLAILTLLGILVGIVLSLRINNDRANKVSIVNVNKFALQSAVEDFVYIHDGIYPTTSDSAEVMGLITGGLVDNPFTHRPTRVYWTVQPQEIGDLRYTLTGPGMYVIVARGDKDEVGNISFEVVRNY